MSTVGYPGGEGYGAMMMRRAFEKPRYSLRVIRTRFGLTMWRVVDGYGRHTAWYSSPHIACEAVRKGEFI